MGADELRTAAHPTQLIVPSSEDLKPKAMRVMSRILVLTDSVRGAPLSVPRSCSSSAVRLTVVKPNAWANRSEPARSGFWNSSQARSRTLIVGLAARPGCSPRSAPCSLCKSLCGP